MADAKQSTASVALSAEKARDHRRERLRMSLEVRLDNPLMVLDWLLAELSAGDSLAELWEKFHVNAVRDGREKEVADGYRHTVAGPRMRRLPPRQQAEVLMHAVDFTSGVLGDAEGATALLERVIELVPDHEDAFGRLERRLEKSMASRRLVELYARVAATPPKPPQVLATQALHRLVTIVPSDMVSDDGCRKLVTLVPVNAKLLDAIEAHCRATKRAALAAEVLEAALGIDVASDEAVKKSRRRRLIELYTGELAKPSPAIDHVERVLERDPHDSVALKAADRLMSQREVGSRAAAALQAARRARAS
ncbi:hypothetical protein [Labilithrix luteola]|nr:hypothetical protein [Labilithrix luteola]